MSPTSLMIRASTVVASVLVVALATAACTVMSGVDDMELRTGASRTSPAPTTDGGKGTPFAAADDPDASRPATSSSSGSIATGPATCGAQGSWTACDVTASLATCASRCAAQGLTCIDSCCAYDSVGDYDAKVGMIYAVATDLECSLKSVSASSPGGSCADPTLLTATGVQVRCCCK